MAHEGTPAPEIIGIPGAENVYRLAEDLDPAVLYERREQLQDRKDTFTNQYDAAWTDIELAINDPDRHRGLIDGAFEKMDAIAFDSDCRDEPLPKVLLTRLGESAIRARVDRGPIDPRSIPDAYGQVCNDARKILETDIDPNRKTGMLGEFLVMAGLLRSRKVMPYFASPREETSVFPRANHDLYIRDPKGLYGKRAFSVRMTDNQTNSRKPAKPITSIYVGPLVHEVMRLTKSGKSLADYHGVDTIEYRKEVQKRLIRYMYSEHQAGSNPHPLYRATMDRFSDSLLRKVGITKNDVFL